MKALYLLIIILPISINSFAQVDLDSLKGIYIGKYYQKSSSVDNWTLVQSDSEIVSYIDTLECNILLEGIIKSCNNLDTTTTFWTDYSYCNNIYDPPTYDVTCYAYPKFYYEDSLRVFFVTPRPQPFVDRINHLFLGKRIPGSNTLVGLNSEKYNNIITVFPKPAQNILHIACETCSNNEITLLDLLGKEVLKCKQDIIDVSELTKGIYFVKVQINNGVYVDSFVKE